MMVLLYLEPQIGLVMRHKVMNLVWLRLRMVKEVWIANRRFPVKGCCWCKSGLQILKMAHYKWMKTALRAICPRETRANKESSWTQSLGMMGCHFSLTLMKDL